jgi:hypothetical protein
MARRPFLPLAVAAQAPLLAARQAEAQSFGGMVQNPGGWMGQAPPGLAAQCGAQSEACCVESGAGAPAVGGGLARATAPRRGDGAMPVRD